MTSIQISSTFVKLILACGCVFTKKSFLYFEALISGILLGRPRKTITAAVKLAGLEKKFSNVHRFVSRYQGDATRLVLAVLTLILKVLQLHPGPVTIALDSTFLAKFGKKIFGCGYHYNYARKPHLPLYAWGT